MTAPPASPDIERDLVATLPDHPELIPAVVDRCRPDWFSDPAMRRVYLATVEAWRDGKPLSSPLIAAQVGRDMTDQERAHMTSRLADFPILTDGALDWWLDTLEDTHRRRLAYYAAHDIIAAASDHDHGADAIAARLADLAGQMAAGRRFVERAEWITRCLDRIDEASNRDGHLAGPSWGLESLDAMTLGMQPSKFAVIAGPTGGGKSAMATYIAVQAARQEWPVLFWSLEMPGEDVIMRMIANVGPTDSMLAQRGMSSKADADGLTNGVRIMRDLPVEVIDDVLPFDDCLNIIRAQVQQRGIKLAVIDYIQIVPPSNRSHPNKERELAEMSGKLARLSKDLDILVVALSQMNDAGELSQCRALGHDANMILTLAPMERSGHPPFPVDIELKKNRGGPTGELHCEFDAPHYQFRETGAPRP